MTNTFHKMGLLLILIKIIALPVIGFAVLDVDNSPKVESKVLGLSNTLHNPVTVKVIDLKVNLNGSERQTFYDVVPKIYLNDFQYSLDYDRNTNVSAHLVKDKISSKINLEISQSESSKIDNAPFSVKIKIIR